MVIKNPYISPQRKVNSVANSDKSSDSGFVSDQMNRSYKTNKTEGCSLLKSKDERNSINIDEIGLLNMQIEDLRLKIQEEIC